MTINCHLCNMNWKMLLDEEDGEDVPVTITPPILSPEEDAAWNTDAGPAWMMTRQDATHVRQDPAAIATQSPHS